MVEGLPATLSTSFLPPSKVVLGAPVAGEGGGGEGEYPSLPPPQKKNGGNFAPLPPSFLGVLAADVTVSPLPFRSLGEDSSSSLSLLLRQCQGNSGTVSKSRQQQEYRFSFRTVA